MTNISKDNIAAFEAVALIHLDSVFRAAFAICGGRQEAEDIVQTTFLKALEKFGSFENGSNCKAWLLRILRNSWIDKLRHNKIAGPSVSIEEVVIVKEDDFRQLSWSNTQDLLENFSDEQVIKALKQLPDDQRLTLFLVDVEQLDHKQVAQIMGVAVGTIKSRASRARKAIKESLRGHKL